MDLLRLLMLLATLLGTFSASAEESVQLTNGDWPPYLSPDLPHYGFASHIVSEAFAAVGIKVNYGFFPWSRAYKYAKSGEGFGSRWNGSLVWIYSKERAESFYYSDEVIADEEILFHLKSTPLQWRTVADLEGKVIGGTQHTLYPPLEAAEAACQISIDRAGSYDVLFQRLLYGRVDAIPQVRHVGDYFIRTSLTPEQSAQITASPTAIQHRKYYLILNRKNPDNKRLMQLFNQGLKQIKKNGIYTRLYAKLQNGAYLPPPSQPAEIPIYKASCG